MKKVRKRKAPKNVIGERVRLVRTKKKLTIVDFVAILNEMGLEIDRTGVSRIENNQRNVYDYEILIIAEALEETTEFLLHGGSMEV
jgi:transcriptional regulator with XRE-family HTH domain